MTERKNEATVSLFLGFLVCSFAECFLVRVSTFPFFTSIIGIVALVVYWRFFSGGSFWFEYTAPLVNFAASVGLALLMYAVGAGVVIGVEELVYLRFENIGFYLKDISMIRYLNAELSLIGCAEKSPMLLLPWAGCAMSLLYAVFSELLFRGMLIAPGVNVHRSYLYSNIRQALYYTAFSTGFILFLICKFFIWHGTVSSILLAIGMMLLYILCTFLYAFSMGAMCGRLDCVWGCVLLTFLIDASVRFVHTDLYLPISLGRYMGLVRLCGLYFVVFLMNIPFIWNMIKRES